VVDFVDGFICYGRPRNKQLVEQLKQVAKHVVTVDFNIGRDASVNVNNQQASFELPNMHCTKVMIGLLF
jgi:DNA-binding LacI/PurR family transcriptional regulator